MLPHVCRYLGRQEGGIGFPGVRVTCAHELDNVGAKKRTRVL